jgi:hypothetical protein
MVVLVVVAGCFSSSVVSVNKERKKKRSDTLQRNKDLSVMHCMRPAAADFSAFYSLGSRVF